MTPGACGEKFKSAGFARGQSWDRTAVSGEIRLNEWNGNLKNRPRNSHALKPLPLQLRRHEPFGSEGNPSLPFDSTCIFRHCSMQVLGNLINLHQAEGRSRGTRPSSSPGRTNAQTFPVCSSFGTITALYRPSFQLFLSIHLRDHICLPPLCFPTLPDHHYQYFGSRVNQAIYVRDRTETQVSRSMYRGKDG